MDRAIRSTVAPRPQNLYFYVYYCFLGPLLSCLLACPEPLCGAFGPYCGPADAFRKHFYGAFGRAAPSKNAAKCRFFQRLRSANHVNMQSKWPCGPGPALDSDRLFDNCSCCEATKQATHEATKQQRRNDAATERRKTVKPTARRRNEATTTPRSINDATKQQRRDDDE